VKINNNDPLAQAILAAVTKEIAKGPQARGFHNDVVSPSTPKRLSAWKQWAVGDRVRHRDAGNPVYGTIVSIVSGRWSNGQVPIARVRWESGSESRVTIKQLVVEPKGEDQ
jgi:hypothetical protein